MAKQFNFRDKFEVDDDVGGSHSGSYLYRTDAMMHRHDDVTYHDVELTPAENRRYEHDSKSYHERVLQNIVQYLLSHGREKEALKVLELDEYSEEQLEDYRQSVVCVI